MGKKKSQKRKLISGESAMLARVSKTHSLHAFLVVCFTAPSLNKFNVNFQIEKELRETSSVESKRTRVHSDTDKSF